MDDPLIDQARDYLGTPWVHQGRLKGIGVDCVGLLVCAARDAGYEVLDVEGYPEYPAGTWLLEELERNCNRVHEEPRVGDVIAFAASTQVWHVGLITQLEPLVVIHCWRKTKRVIEVQLDKSWRYQIHSIWRLKARDG